MPGPREVTGMPQPGRSCVGAITPGTPTGASGNFSEAFSIYIDNIMASIALEG